MPAFYVIQGNDQGQRFELLESTATIGRDPNNHIQLRDPEVSRRHAHIEFVDGSYHLIDDGSANGIRVNGQQIVNHPLVNGDQVLMGQTLLLFALNPAGDSGRNEDFPDGTDREAGFGRHAAASIEDDYLHHFPLLTNTESWSSEAIGHLKMMYHTTLVTTQTLEIGVLLHRILDLISEWVTIDRGCILLCDSETSQLVPKVAWQQRKDPSTQEPPRFSINQSIVRYVVKRREGVLTNDIRNAEKTEDGRSYVRDVICVPMLGRYGLVGIIYIDSRNLFEPFTGQTPIPTTSNQNLSPDHLRLMIVIAHQAALAVEDTRYYKGMIQAERLAAVGQTITTLSHHIKNILQGISGGSHLIQTGLNKHNEELIGQGWSIVEKNQSRISQLILDMLTFSKEREPAYELADIVETISDIVELMLRRAEEADVELTFKPTKTIPQFFFDVEQIHRALTNIITNGIDAARLRSEAMKEAPEVDPGMDTLVSVRLFPDDGQQKGVLRVEADYLPDKSLVRITIDDNGPGIPPSQRKYLFRPFYSEKKGRGTGLGLSVAHKVVREHGGTIRIDGSPLGGARFEVELPLKLEPPDYRK